MRGFSVLLCISLAVLFACSKPEKPPTGRWIGNLENSDVMVDARLEILPDGTVKVSAPDITDVGDIGDADRAALHQRLAAYYYLMGNVQESLVEFEKGLTLDSESAEEFFEFCADAVIDPLYNEILAKFLPTKE